MRRTPQAAWLGGLMVAALAAAAPPAGWDSADIGAVGVKGSVEAIGDHGLVVEASGSDIWETSDGFRFVWQKVKGDCTVTCYVDSLAPVDQWSKAGVMLRQSTAAGAAHALMCVTPGNGVAFQYRAKADGSSTHNPGSTSAKAPQWLRLTRVGDLVTGYVLNDNGRWQKVSEATIALGDEILAGVAVTSHKNSQATRAVFYQPNVQAH